MTPKQILDSFSETLMQDERILSAPERALLANLLQHARAASSENAELHEGVRTVIASAVGETVAQRAFTVLGSSIVERILESDSLATTVRSGEIYAREPQPPGARKPAKEPQPPGARKPLGEPQPPGAKEPQPPGARKPVGEPQPPGAHKPAREPQPPGAHRPVGEPQPPGHSVSTTVVSQTSVAVAERPPLLPARCVVLEEFLAPQELEELTQFTMAHEADFQTSVVVSAEVEDGVTNYEHRRSRVLMDLGRHEQVILERVKSVLPEVLEELGMDEFLITEVEAQITASNDGDFFHFHSDNGSERVRSRHLTFVYFFHREPREFEGGELRIHDSQLEEGTYVSTGTYQTIVPRQNQIVFFPCELMHEITAVKCPSGSFADSRFTLNGWLRQ